MEHTIRIREREDRLQAYLKPYLKDFVFGEFSATLLARPEFPGPLRETMKGVPIPLKEGDLREFAGAKGLAPDRIADNMVWVMGCDPAFRFVPDYCTYLATMFHGQRLSHVLLTLAQEALEKERYDDALVHVRAVLLLFETGALKGEVEENAMRDALFAYAMVTRAMYQQEEGGDSEYAGRCKAESLEFLEVLAVTYPDYAAGQYHLGYAYANLGLYLKAQLTWERYLALAEEEAKENGAADTSAERREIRERLAEIEDPVKIEEGINHAQAARYGKAIAQLAPYREGRFADWWPLHYFLGLSYVETGELAKAKESFKRVLRLQPAHVETLEELAALCTVEGDTVNAEKYRRKAEIVKEGFEE